MLLLEERIGFHERLGGIGGARGRRARIEEHDGNHCGAAQQQNPADGMQAQPGNS